MIITDQSHLRSLLKESGRQADFYNRRNDDDLSAFWSQIESLAFRARISGQSLIIGIQSVQNPPIINGCEQVQ
jgi:hypothetical protein